MNQIIVLEGVAATGKTTQCDYTSDFEATIKKYPLIHEKYNEEKIHGTFPSVKFCYNSIAGSIFWKLWAKAKNEDRVVFIDRYPPLSSVIYDIIFQNMDKWRNVQIEIGEDWVYNHFGNELSLLKMVCGEIKGLLDQGVFELKILVAADRNRQLSIMKKRNNNLDNLTIQYVDIQNVLFTMAAKEMEIDPIPISHPVQVQRSISEWAGGFWRVDENGETPTRKTLLSAGFDIYCYDFEEVGNGIVRGRTGLYLTDNFPQDSFFKIELRSSISLMGTISLVGGIIDSDYRGEVLILFKTSLSPSELREIVCQKKYLVQGIVIPYVRDVYEKNLFKRNGGFGSTN